MSAVGILGGTFDPVHFGHLRLAQEMAEGLGLCEVRLVPAGIPPHRAQPAASAPHRLAMVQRAIAANPLFCADPREIERAGPCYTVDTLSGLRAELGADRPLCLLMGADAFLGLATWHRWQEIFDLAHVAVAFRPGFPEGAWTETMPEALKTTLRARCESDPAALRARAAGGVYTHPITPLDIAASRIRSALEAGRSARYLLPDAVLDYIQCHHLYVRPPEQTPRPGA
ncbi:MAG: nicotinate-nucleotide adenylyltransferase [Betaproteobacteria bacterium]|nr:nicotinate-nucleotide adenylyltransferase [Betaproteobacteria bacterium]